VDHTILIDNFLRDQGCRVVYEWNCFQPPYDAAQGWPLRMPAVDWQHTDFVVLVFQDFVTMHDGVCVELQQVEQRYGKDCDKVIVLHWPYALHRYYHGPINLVNFNVHEYMILNNLRQMQTQWIGALRSRRDLSWMSINGRKCPHRLQVVRHLQHTWCTGTVSLGDTVPLARYPYSTYRGTSNEDNWLRLAPLYARHHFNIVTETQYDQTPGIITEKTIFAVLAAQIPIVIGYPGIVRDCEALGFDMFTDIVDVSYDHLLDDQRWQAALDLNRGRVLDYRPATAITQRLQQQAEWLLTEWPQQHLQQALHRLTEIVTTQGWQ